MRNYFKGAIFISLAMLSWLASVVIINIFIGTSGNDEDEYNKPLMIVYYEMSLFMLLLIPTIFKYF